MKGTTDISNSGQYATPKRPRQGFYVLQTGNAEALTTDASQRFQKLWIYPGKTNGAGGIAVNANVVTVGKKGTLIDGTTELDVVSDALQPTDLPIKIELPVGMSMQLQDIIVKGTAGDGVFYSFWG